MLAAPPAPPHAVADGPAAAEASKAAAADAAAASAEQHAPAGPARKLQELLGAIEKPLFHVAPRAGWVNDPNGPLVFRGQYHLFYQHLERGCEWAFGLVWGHAVSRDLVTWRHLPNAIVPSAGGLDADGAFSGCACVDTDGTPTILYTGVRLRSNDSAGPLPPPGCDLNLPFIESQIAAVADPDDEHLISWRKDERPFIALPPPDMQLTGWRDPFVLERPSAANGHEWAIMVGAGIKDVGGTALVYRSPSLRNPSKWRYDGLLCSGDGDTGAVWECPLLCRLRPLPPPTSQHLPAHTLGLPPRGGGAGASFARLPPVNEEGGGGRAAGGSGSSFGDSGPNHTAGSASLSGLSAEVAASERAELGSAAADADGAAADGGGDDGAFDFFYSISPDACTNPSLYWLGSYSDGRFDFERAIGPFRLDLGDVLYAPNLMEDGGRTLLWGWLQERRSVGTYDYAGCMTVPRLMYRAGERLWQEPAPELAALRAGEAWRAADVQLTADSPLPLGAVSGPFLDIELTWRQGSASTVGVLLRSWNAGGEGGAAVLYNWETRALEVVFEALDPATMEFSLTAPTARHIGGQLDVRPGEPLSLRLLLDYSVLEVFTSSGQALATRVYRGTPPSADAGAGIELVALDGSATLARAAAWEMRTIWAGDPSWMAAGVAAAAAEAEAAEAAGGEDAALAAAALEKALSLPALSLSRPLSRAGSLAGDAFLAAAAAATPRGGLAAPSPTAAGAQQLQHLLLYGGVGAGLPAEFFDDAARAAVLLPEEEMTADIFADLLADLP